MSVPRRLLLSDLKAKKLLYAPVEYFFRVLMRAIYCGNYFSPQIIYATITTCHFFAWSFSNESFSRTFEFVIVKCSHRNRFTFEEIFVEHEEQICKEEKEMSGGAKMKGCFL